MMLVKHKRAFLQTSNKCVHKEIFVNEGLSFTNITSRAPRQMAMWSWLVAQYSTLRFPDECRIATALQSETCTFSEPLGALAFLPEP
jgi:hypothetical protein